MLDDLGHRSMAILFRVFDLVADFSVTFSLPDHGHRSRRQSPAGRAWRHVLAGDVVVLMAGAALLRRDPKAADAPADVHSMRMTVIALPWKIARGVAVQATRMFEDRQQRSEQRGIAGSGRRSGFRR
jgi:hypothetical protein